jgi:CHAT domain-containing protein/tetratricopeptide (TPR) repeat protein
VESHSHLAAEDIEGALRGGLDQEQMSHLISCRQCSAALEVRGGLAPRASPAVEDLATRPDCSSPVDLSLFAAGALPEEAAARILRHLQSCDRCGFLLKRSAAVAEDTEAVHVPDWAPEMAQRLSGAAARRWGSAIRWGAIAATLVLAAGGWITYQAANSPDALLAEAFTEGRPFEFRLKDRGYSQTRMERGQGQALSRPAALLRAELSIQTLLRRHPAAAETLDLEGRSELLEGQYDKAVDDLKGARDAAPGDPHILSDLGCAFALRGDAENRPADYGDAVNEFAESLKREPQQPLVLFNLALAYARQSLIEEALGAWDKFLALEPSGGWAAEARRNRAELERRRQKRNELRQKAASGAAGFLAWGQTSPDQINAELFQDAAWSDWLPRAAQDAQAAAALGTLGAMFAERYGDTSLKEASISGGGLGLGLLADAVQQTLKGAYDAAFESARRAEDLLRENRPARFRARLEQSFARQRAKPEECLDAALTLRRDLVATPYIWMRGQATLQEGICRARAGDLGTARKLYAEASAALERAHLDTVDLRARGSLAGADRSIGNLAAVWKEASSGLHQSWEIAAPPARAQQFDFHLAEAARALGWANTAAVYGGAFVREISATGNQEIEALNRVYLAALLREAGDDTGAEQQLLTAEKEFRNLPPSPTTASLIRNARLTRTEVLPPGSPAALPELLSLEASSGEMIWQDQLRLKQALGRALTASGNLPGGKAAFRDAIRLHQAGLKTLKDPVALIAAGELAEPAYKNLAELQLVEDHDAQAAFATWELYRGGAFATHPSGPTSAAPGASLVYAVLPHGIAVWALRGASLQGHMLRADPGHVQRATIRLQRECSQPDSGQEALRTDAAELYRWLIQPFEQTLKDATEWSLDADSWLGGIPFQVLIDGQGHYLNERHAIMIGGPSVLEGIRAHIDSGSRLLVVSAAAPGGTSAERFPPLPAAAAEGNEISRMFRAAVVLKDSAASERAVREAARGATLLHFTGHGWSNGGDGGLVLPAAGASEEPAYLTAASLAHQDWSRCSLVVLSACMSGSGELRGPVNPQSLVRAFLSAGAHTVVASRWNVDSEVTRTLMNSFYRSLLSGADPASALAEANKALLRNPVTAHPYYWGAFAVFGRP